MRWYNFVILSLVALLCLVLQVTIGQMLWFRTSSGWVGPEFLAAAAVFMALYAASSTDAVLSGWVLGFAADLAISGSGMGLLPLLYAAGCLGIFKTREVFFRDKAITRIIMSFLFCVFVYELWTIWDIFVCGRASAGYLAPLIQVIGLSVYTALLTPLVCAAMVRLGNFLLPALPNRQRR